MDGCMDGWIVKQRHQMSRIRDHMTDYMAHCYMDGWMAGWISLEGQMDG